MREVRPLSENELFRFIDIADNAYPAFQLTDDEKRRKFSERLRRYEDDPVRAIYGLYEEDQLLGQMILYDFNMNMLGTMLPAGGVGQVAVDLLHKKKRVAKQLIEFFHDHYRRRGAPLALLYPFRPDFYKQMGYGYGSKMSQYRVPPAGLPRGRREDVRYLAEADLPAVLSCYNRAAGRTHGMITRTEAEMKGFFAYPAPRIIGYEKDGRLLGYLAFTFERAGNFIQNDLVVRELIYEDAGALLGLLAFLHVQFDQIGRIVINTLDEDFHHLLLDPANDTGNLIPSVYHESNLQGVGLMYRVLDTPALFAALADHDFGGHDLRLRLVVNDSFLPANDGATIIHFVSGRPVVSEGDDYDVTLELDVAEFSSLIMGCISLKKLHRYGLARLSGDHYLTQLNDLFAVPERPVCLTAF